MSRLQTMIDSSAVENIEDVEFSDIMGTYYVDYAMSVIISRAVPEIRDGLKPVQRRILYSMNELKANSNTPFKKSARISGDTMGKYHPHGSSAIYETMVNLAQDFKKGQILVEGHGNFGSIEGDGAAADRYTEARLDKFSEDVFLSELKYDTVDFHSNYDETLQEPEVLPCKLPHILINGAEGIAVGMTTSIPTHNVGEVIDTAIKYIDDEHSKVETLVDTLNGPDFATGGIICNKSDLLNIYKTGKGKIRIRGRVEFEPGESGQHDKLVVTEIPYTMIGEGINKFLSDAAKLVETKVLPEITDIINQSSNEGIRIVFELKKNSDIERIKNVLYKKTKLEDTLGVNMLAVNQGTPQVMSLVEILKTFLDFQKEIYTRKYNNLLSKSEKKKEIDEGLIKAVDIIDIIIEILRGSENISQAKRCLTLGDTNDIKFKTELAKTKAKDLNFSESQADAILSMQLSRLVGLQLEELRADYDKLEKEITEYNKILSDESELKKQIKLGLKDLKKKYSRERRTEITDISAPTAVNIEVPEVTLFALIDKFNYIHAIEKEAYSRNKQFILDNFKYCVEISSRDKLAIFTNIGKVHLLPMTEVPLQKPRDKGVPLDNICNYQYNIEEIVGVHSLQYQSEEKQFIFIGSTGSIKRTKNSEFFINRKVTDSTILREGENVFEVIEYTPEKYLIFETAGAKVLKIRQDDIKVKGKFTQGAVCLKLLDKDSIKFVTDDDSDYTTIKCGSFGSSGRVRPRKLV